jgi:hypothetical protein
MSHFAVIVVTPVREDLRGAMLLAEAAVSELLAPYDENYSGRSDGGGWFAAGSRWDWWVIGGRYAGMLHPPAGTKPCNQCDGEGTRGLLECFFCGGAGTYEYYETRHGVVGNHALVKHIDFSEWSYLVTPEGEWHERSRPGWFGVKIPDEDGRIDKVSEFDQACARVRDEYPNHIAVLVDCHV